ncbi:MAG TPA: helix-turn-helix domain-containing protein, partial [Ktedonobacteraceae bacterium]|nr:helix-turn-helix domain-containing protein [Ktedonobacteraceae bacterium]
MHAKATVTISRAAELSGFTENQLRDWEKRGLFNRERNAKQDGKGSPHRQYTPADLEKLAILSDLYEQRYPIGELLREAEAISQIADTLTGSHAQAKEDQVGVERLPIDQRVERMNDESSWRYFVSQALRLSLMLICEAMPDTIVGLVLPLHKDLKKSQAPEPANLRDVGQALIGWLEPNQPFCAFLDPAPHFEVASDFRIHKLMVMEANVPEEDAAQDSTLIVVQRKAKPLTLTPLVVETIRGLLALVYQNVDTWKSCFDYGTRDWVYHGTNFTGDVVPTDVLLKSLTNMVVELGGKTASGRNRWNFCCILLPQDNTLPLQQRSLVVRAQSDAAPHMLETTVVSPRDKNPGLSIKAFQSGQSFYRTEISPDDPMIAYRTQEGPIRSAIAIPISGE